jgi:hypothetical protein
MQEVNPMEATGGKSRMRLMVVDFLATLFVTFCIGVSTALVLAACVMLMAGEAHGAAPAKPRAEPGAQASTSELLLAHYFAARYAGLVAVERIYPAEPRPGSRSASLRRRCKG